MLLVVTGAAGAPTAPQTVQIKVEAHSTGTPFPHFRETTFGSGRTSLALRDDYRKELLVLSEYNASYATLPNITDTIFMGPWTAGTIRDCTGKIQIMSCWSLSDVFEEQDQAFQHRREASH